VPSGGIDSTLYETRPIRLATDIARSYALIVAAIGLAVWHPAWWVIVPAIVVIGTQQYALQIIMHDALHSRLAASKRNSDRVARLFVCYPIVNPITGFRRKHLDHHQLLGNPADPDRYYHRTDDKATRLGFVLFLLGVSSIWTTLRAALTRRHGRATAAVDPAAAAEARFDLWAVVATQAAIAAVLTVVGGWWAYPVLWLVPYYLGVFVAQNLRSFAEHAHPVPDAVADANRDITFAASWIERTLFAPHHMSHHAEHHMYPAVPYYNLPALRAYLEAEGRMGQVEYRRSYVGFALTFWRHLPIRPDASRAAERKVAAPLSA
jgi:fatty acid desaturase